MKALIVTVAGIASRFNKDLDKEVPKCLYYKDSIKKSLLYRILDKARDFDKIVIVGGYLYEVLEENLKEHFKEFAKQIILIQNERYREYGSCYSLYLGIEALKDSGVSEMIFVEGDLYYNSHSFMKICESKKDVITINNESIIASKAVALYFDRDYQLHYIYNTKHGALQINEPFEAIYNSAQIWKFIDTGKLFAINRTLSDSELQGTNLEVIQKYYQSIPYEQLDIVLIDHWVNCNTVADYDHVMSL